MTQTITLPPETITNLFTLADDHFEAGTLISCYLDIRLNHDFYSKLWKKHSLDHVLSLAVDRTHGLITDQEFSTLLNREDARFYAIAAEYITEDFDISAETAAKVFELATLDHKSDRERACAECECAECEIDCADCDFNRCRKVDGGCPVPTF